MPLPHKSLTIAAALLVAASGLMPASAIAKHVAAVDERLRAMDEALYEYRNTLEARAKDAPEQAPHQ